MLDRITKTYPGDEEPALDNVSLHIEPHEFVFLVGKSGAGKSTLIKMITKEEQPDSGKIIVGGIDLDYVKKRHIPHYRRRLGVVFQDYKLLPTRTVFENVAFALEIAGMKNREIMKTVPKILDLVGLGDKAHKFPAHLSGGEQQRVSIARSVARQPKILIADEPTTALDVTIQAQILDLIRGLQKELNMTVIYITHDLGVVANVADRVAVMYAGQIVEYGNVDEIFYDAWHPYTWALLSSLPQLGVKGEELPTIDGTPPNLFNEVKGDAFAPRNKQALAIDFEEEPPFFEVSPTHKAKTWYLDPRAPKVEQPKSIKMLREKMKK